MIRERRQGVPELPIVGVYPWESLERIASLSYQAYYSGEGFRNVALVQHPREDDEDFAYRKKLAYSLGRTSWCVDFLTKTLANNQYPVSRQFGERYPELTQLESNRAPSGKSWDDRLKEAVTEALIGGVAYIFIDRNAVGPTLRSLGDDLEQLKGTVESYILRAPQVGNIVITPDGYVTQCEIIETRQAEQSTANTTPLPDKVLTRYFTLEGVPAYDVWLQRKSIGNWEKVEEGINDLGFAPLIPVVIKGELSEPHTLTTPVQAIVPIDVDIMNILSDTRHAFGLHNYPWVALPESEGVVSVDGKNTLKKIPLGPAQAFLFNAKDGIPHIIEPQNLHLDQALKLIDFLNVKILELIGASSLEDHPLASGVSKAFSFNDTNETRRSIHAKVEGVESQAWYIIAKMLNPNVEAFIDFKQQVRINHPTSFDPTGGQAWAKVNEIIASPIYSEVSPEIKTEIQKQYLRLALKELMTADELNLLMELMNVSESTRGTSERQPSNAGASDPSSGGDDPTGTNGFATS